MTEAALTVPTAFVDISQLAEGLADRVDEGRLMLYGPSSFTEGEWVRFAVLLADESAALEGVGRVVTSIDGGEERPDVARWDVVLDSLQLEGMGEVVYERILMVRGGAFGDEHATGEVSLDDVEHVEDAAAAPRPGDEFVDEATSVAEEDYGQHVAASVGSAEYGQPMGFDEADETVVSAEDDAFEPAMADASRAAPGEPASMDVGFQDAGWAQGGEYGTEEPGWADAGDVAEVQSVDVDDVMSVPPSAPPPAPPPQPGGFRIDPVGAGGNVLARPSRGASWYPEVVPPPDPRPSSGLFGFAGGLPVPQRPPRPDIDPSMRIQPAPRPESNGASAAEPAYAPPVQNVDATDPSFSPPDVEEDWHSQELDADYEVDED